MTLVALIRWPWEPALPITTPTTVAIGAPDPRAPDELNDIRKAITDLTTVTAAQNEKLYHQANEIEKAHQLIKALQTVEAQLRGDLREAYTRITALESQLSEERIARTRQAEELGTVKAQLSMADERLQKQRTDLTAQGKQIAILEEERAKAINTSQVWQLRAQAYAEQLRAHGLIPANEAPDAQAGH